MGNSKICDNCEKKIPASQVWDNESFFKLALCDNCATNEYLIEKKELSESLENVEIGLERLSKEEKYAKKLASAIDEFAKGQSKDISGFSDIDDLGDLTFEEAQALLNNDVDFVREKNIEKQREIEAINKKNLREQKDSFKKNKKKEKEERKRKLKVDFSDEEAEKFLIDEGIIEAKVKKNNTIDFDFDSNDFDDFDDED